MELHFNSSVVLESDSKGYFPLLQGNSMGEEKKPIGGNSGSPDTQTISVKFTGK